MQSIHRPPMMLMELKQYMELEVKKVKGENNMNKKIIIVISIVILIISCVACTSKSTDNDENISIQANDREIDFTENMGLSSIPIVDEGETRYISNHLNRLKIFTTFDQLKDEARAVFTGTCISSQPVFQNDTLYTLSEIKIKTVYKGNFAVGDTILIFEMGGRTTYGEYEKGCHLDEKAFEQGGERMPDDQKMVIGDDGFFPLQVNEEVLLFTRSATDFLQGAKESQYGIVGAYDGKLFLQEDGSYARPLPNETDKLQFGEGTLTITAEQLNAILK